MKVLHLLDSVNRGGAETIVLDVCRNAERSGIDLAVAITNSGDLEEDFQNSGAEFFRLRRNFPVDLKLIKDLRKIIKEKNIEIVHGHQAVDGLHLHLATIGLNVKKVLTFHGFIQDKKNHLTAKYLIPRMDANITVSHELEEWLKEKLNLVETKNFHLVHNGVDKKRLAPGGKSVKEELGFEKDSLLLAMIANFPPEPRKDQITVCRALPKVLAKRNDVNFIFVGNIAPGGEAKFDKCVDICKQNGIDERVHFLGGRDDVPDILNALDIFVLSSLHEGLPIAVIEAMLAGVPVILSDIKQLLEVSGNGKYAEIFPTQNPEILCEKILKLLDDEERRKSLATRAQKFALDNFSIEAHLQKLKEIYHLILK